MKRLGKYSGRIYEENEAPSMKECGVIITDEQANDDKYIKSHHAKDLVDCLGCGGCPMFQKGIVSVDKNNNYILSSI